MKKIVSVLTTMLLGLVPASAWNTVVVPDNSLYVLDVTVEQGSQTALSVCMKNTAEVQTIGTYLSLPDGFFVPVQNGDYSISLSQARTDAGKHSIGSNLVGGEYRVAVLQSTGAPFTGREGEVFTVTVDVADTVEPGEYEVRLFNSELSGVDDIISQNGEFKGRIFVTRPTAIQEVMTEGENAANAGIYNTNGMRLPSMRPGINIVKDANSGTVRKVMK